jgi:thiamine-monophosphate kinase
VKEGAWLAQHKYATSMMDVSDGILMDLGRLAKASEVDVEIDPAVIPARRSGLTPQQILTDGEDYELLFTVPASKELELRKAWPFTIPLTCIGRVLKCGKGIIFNRKNENLADKFATFSHF